MAGLKTKKQQLNKVLKLRLMLINYALVVLRTKESQRGIYDLGWVLWVL